MAKATEDDPGLTILSAAGRPLVEVRPEHNGCLQLITRPRRRGEPVGLAPEDVARLAGYLTGYLVGYAEGKGQ